MFIEKVRMPTKRAFSLVNTEGLKVHLYVILTGSDKGWTIMFQSWNINTFALSYHVKLWEIFGPFSHLRIEADNLKTGMSSSLETS